MTHFKTILLITGSVALLGLGACGKKDEGKKEGGGGAAAKKEGGGGGNKLAGACDRRAGEKLCEEYHGKSAKPDWVKEQCGARNVPFLDACPKEGAVGRCVIDPGTPSETQLLFYPDLTKEVATAMCTGLSGKLQDP